MSGFQYKGIGLSNILDSGTASTKFIGLSTNNVSYNKNKPLPISYQIDGVDISNTVRANYKFYSTSSAVVVPTGAKHFRFYGRGGGGGGGGSGGKALNRYLKYAYVYGGDGGNGANGGYASVDKTAIVGTTFNVVVGAGGAQGNVGTSNDTKNPTKGGNGNAGGAGGPTYYIMNGSSDAQGAGGARGEAGLGGTANDGADAEFAKVANTPDTAANVSIIPSDWEPISAFGGGRGFGGSGGSAALEPDDAYGNNGSAGSAGYARIIWLYDI
jgi:hypothetical protein